MMGGWKKDSLCYWKMEVGGRFRNAWSTFAKKQEQSLGKQFTLRNNRRKAILSKLLKYSTWIFIIQIQFLDHYLSSYRLGDCTQWKTSNGGWISANEFQNHIYFRTEWLTQSYYWHCLQCLNGVSRCTSLHKTMIVKIPRHAPFPSDFHRNHLERVQGL